MDNQQQNNNFDPQNGQQQQNASPNWQSGQQQQNVNPNWQNGQQQQNANPNWQNGQQQQNVNPNWQNGQQQQNANPNWQNGQQQQNANPNWQNGQQQQNANPNWQNNQQWQNNASYQAGHTPMGDPADVQANKAVSILAYLGILFFLPLVACPNSKFGRFHANQALLLLLASAALNIATRIIKAPIDLFSFGFPFSYISGTLTGATGIAIVVFMIIGMVSASKGEMKPLPIIGSIEIIK